MKIGLLVILLSISVRSHGADCQTPKLSFQTSILGTTDSWRTDRAKATFVSEQLLEGWDYSEENGFSFQSFAKQSLGRSHKELLGMQKFDFGKLQHVEVGSASFVSYVEIVNNVERAVKNEVPVFHFLTSKGCGFTIVMRDTLMEESDRLRAYYEERIGLDLNFSFVVEARQPLILGGQVLTEGDGETRSEVIIRDAFFHLTCSSPSEHPFCKVK